MHMIHTCQQLFDLFHVLQYITSAGLGCSPSWETPSSPDFPTGTVNPGLKARPLLPDLVTGIEWGPFSPGYLYQPELNGPLGRARGRPPLVLVGITNRD